MSWLSDGFDWLGGQFGSGNNWGSDLSNFFGGGSTGQIGTNMDGSPIMGPTSSGGGGFNFGDNWLTRNWDTIGKVVNAGRGIYNMFDANGNRQGVRNDLLDAYSQYMMQQQLYNQQMAGMGGGGGGGGGRARAAQLAAAKKALAVQKKYLTDLQKQYKPYADAAKTLTPKMTKNYKQYLDSTALLNAYLTPTVMGQMKAPIAPAYTQNIPSSAYETPKLEGGAVSFPTLEEILKGAK